MTHIKDQIENLCESVARKAYLKGISDAREIVFDDKKISNDDTNDALLEIVKKKWRNNYGRQKYLSKDPTDQS